MPPIWTEYRIPCDLEDSEEPAVRARRIMETEARRAAAECARLPEIRLDRVRRMRARLASGEYRISSDALADTMIRQANLSRLSR